MPHAYTGDHLVEQPAIGLFTEPGRTVVVALAGDPKHIALMAADLVAWGMTS